MKETVSDLQHVVRAIRQSFFAVCLFSLFINLLMLVVPLYMIQLYDRVLSNKSFDTLYLLTAIAAVAMLTYAMLEGIRNFILQKIGVWIDSRLDGPILHASIVKAKQKSQRSSIQGLRDLAVIRNFLSGPSIVPVLDAPWSPLFIAVLFLLHPMLGWITLVGGLVLFAFALFNEYATKDLNNDAHDHSVVVQEQAQSALRNADSIDAMGMRNALVNKWRRNNKLATELQTKAGHRTATISAVVRFFRQMLQICVLFTAAILVMNQEMSAGGLFAAVLLMRRAVSPVDNAISSWKSVQAARKAYKNLTSLLTGKYVEEPTSVFPVPEGNLRVEAVSYKHNRKQRSLFRNVSFEAGPGDVFGLIGPSGAGKSTLARLLVGNISPTSGHIRLDEIELVHWHSEDLGQYVGYLPQNVELFEGTVRENIARMTEGDMTEIVAAAMLAGAHEFICRLPEGYESEIGEDGMVLSGGQRQRIALARALYKMPKLLILDEADSNLDSDGRRALHDAVLHMKQHGATVIIITHKPDMLKHADKVLMLHRARIEVFDADHKEKPVKQLTTSFSKPRKSGSSRNA